MGMLCAVSFNRAGQLYYFDPAGVEVAVGDQVLVPVGDQAEVAEVVWASEWVSDDTDGFAKILGLAGDRDRDRAGVVRKAKARTRVAAKRLIRDHGLPMKVVGIDVELDAAASRLVLATVFFSAPHRVDFRALVRDLAATIDARIDLRQVNPRDEMRLQNAIGSSGRDTCCSTFLADFEPVSLRMARDQDLPVNPMRIAGACGRLMCCLKFEHPLYSKYKSKAPELGSCVSTSEGDGRVVEHRALEDAVVVRLDDDGQRVTCPLASVCSSRAAYESRP